MSYSLGIDIGYSAVKTVLLDGNKKPSAVRYVLHKGRVQETLQDCLEELSAICRQQNIAVDDIQLGAVTGSGSKFIAKMAEVQVVNEVAAMVEGSKLVAEDIGSIIEIGGESAKYITGLSKGRKTPMGISLNSNCAAGTGSFLEEQMSRLNLKLEDYSEVAGRAGSVPRIAGRCSVFAKTDITFRQQEGVPVEDILLGLAYAVIKNYKGAVMKKLPFCKPVLFGGGVAYNRAIITALKDVLHLTEEELILPPDPGNLAALGAAVLACKENYPINLEELLRNLKTGKTSGEKAKGEITLPRLISYGQNDSANKHSCLGLAGNSEKIDCYLGIDIGSTSTNLVVMNQKQEIIWYKYLRTLGNPRAAVRIGFQEMRQELGDRMNVVGAGTTGSGRYLIGELIGADIVKDEITAQAKAAVTIDGSVDTIFEIGGQDSKYIRLEDGLLADFQMNKICAAGTGSFLEEQAVKFNIPVNDFGSIALRSCKPLDLGERCTVFMETSIAASLFQGAKIEDIASGLCYSVVKNYLNRVVGHKKIGDKIFFQGGLAYNQGVINAFRALTGKDIVVPAYFSVTGAYGAALLTKEEMGSAGTRFKGCEVNPGEPEPERKQGQLKMYAVQQGVPKQNQERRFNQIMEELLFAGYDGVRDKKKKTVGIPRVLFAYGMFPMFQAFFQELGFNVLLSDSTSEETVGASQEYAQDEPCYPVKLINGHVAELAARKVDYIFYLNLYSIEHYGSMSRRNYGCAYMQQAAKIMEQSMDLKARGIELLTPTITYQPGEEYLREAFIGLGRQLELNEAKIEKAFRQGKNAQMRFGQGIAEQREKMLQTLRTDEKVFVVISKSYILADPLLNMGIPEKLLAMGYKVLPFYDLPETNIFAEHPNMFWPFGQHILEAAQVIKQHPNLYAVFISNHGCGPDTVLAHYIKEMMKGKPFLHIEVDEHSSGVGVITRVEAFVNSLKKVQVRKAEDWQYYSVRSELEAVHIKKGLAELKARTTVYLPYLEPYSDIFQVVLSKKGIKAEVLSRTSRVSVDRGRKYTLTNEYFSLTALLGDIFQVLSEKEKQGDGENIAFFLPQNEGTELDGQYSRFLRTKLNEEGFSGTDILSPFLEDALIQEEEDVKLIQFGLLAGDLIRMAPKEKRPKHLQDILDFIKTGRLELKYLKEKAQAIREELLSVKFKKRVLAVGEAMVLYNDFLNNFTFSKLEDQGHRVVYSPLSEAMWMLWRDFGDQNKDKNTPLFRQRLDEFQNDINVISGCLEEESPFENNLDNLVTIADQTVGYYAGANGRYREAKLLGDLQGIDGMITVASMYENTGIVLNVLHKGFQQMNEKPVLNLTFDGNRNENDETKIESFRYYL